jgi:hypothetical protein
VRRDTTAQEARISVETQDMFILECDPNEARPTPDTCVNPHSTINAANYRMGGISSDECLRDVVKKKEINFDEPTKR